MKYTKQYKSQNIDPDYSPPKSQNRNCRCTKQTIMIKRLINKTIDFSLN